jgi:uncharacterized protein
MPLEFEWDISKAVVNLKKHRVAFDEACAVFDDPFAAIFRDEDRSISEVREFIIGNSNLSRLVQKASPVCLTTTASSFS